MPVDQELLERTVSRLRQLRGDEFEMVEDYLDLLEANRGVHILTAEELAVLEPAKARARAGEFASRDEVDRVLRRPSKR